MANILKPQTFELHYDRQPGEIPIEYQCIISRFVDGQVAGLTFIE